MIELTLYGRQSSTYEYLKNMILKQGKRMEVDLQINEVTDASEFIEQNITKIPAVKIGEEIKINQSNDIIKFAEEVNEWISKKENFGKMSKIIVPIDFSDTSRKATLFAIDWAIRLDAVLKIIHIYHPMVSTINNTTYIDPNALDSSKDIFEREIDNIKNLEVVKNEASLMIDHEFLVGFAADEIIKQSQEEGRNIIVMGSTGSRGIIKKIFGSVSTKVAKFAKCPILIIPPESNTSAFKNIAFCTTDIPEEASTIQTIVELAKVNKAKIHLIHVADENNPKDELVLKQWAKYYPIENIHIQLVHNPNIVEGINEYCLYLDIDMIALNRRNKSFVKELFAKSITRSLAIHTNIPILITHNQ